MFCVVTAKMVSAVETFRLSVFETVPGELTTEVMNVDKGLYVELQLCEQKAAFRVSSQHWLSCLACIKVRLTVLIAAKVWLEPATLTSVWWSCFQWWASGRYWRTQHESGTCDVAPLWEVPGHYLVRGFCWCFCLRCYYLQSLGFMKGFLSLHLTWEPVASSVCWGNKIFGVLLGDFQLPEEQPSGCCCLLSECGMGGGWGQWCWRRGGLDWSWMVQRWSENPVPEAEMFAAAKRISVKYPHSGSEDGDLCKRGCSTLFSLQFWNYTKWTKHSLLMYEIILWQLVITVSSLFLLCGSLRPSVLHASRWKGNSTWTGHVYFLYGASLHLPTEALCDPFRV